MNFFADTFITKALPQIFAGWRAQNDAEKDEAAEAFVAAVEKELEPLFNWDDAKGPFFGGSKKVTLAEVSLPHRIHNIASLSAESSILIVCTFCIGFDRAFRASASWPQQGRIWHWEPKSLSTAQREGAEI